LVTDNAKFQPYEIDCYVEELNLGFEADGAPYHTWKRKDAVRDQRILEVYNIPILRLSDKLINRPALVKVRIMEWINENANIK
jgi:very-short-patch-repair endonuclease